MINRSSTHISDPCDQEKERAHIKEVLSANGYPDWSLTVPNQSDAQKRQDKKKETSSTSASPLIGLPYIAGLSEELQRVFKNHGVSVYHKPTNTLRSLLVKPKDKQNKKDKCGTVYMVTCSCDDLYVGETARALGKRFTEHTSSDKQSAVLEHLRTSGHSLSFDDVSVLANEPNYHSRKVREAVEIFKNKPQLNRDQGFEIAPVLLQLLPTPKTPHPPDPGPAHHPRAPPRVGFRTNSL